MFLHQAFILFFCFGDLNLYFYSDTDNILDSQVPFLPSTEVSVKALVVISAVALSAAPSASMQVILCSHHPYIIGTAKRDTVWRVSLVN